MQDGAERYFDPEDVSLAILTRPRQDDNTKSNKTFPKTLWNSDLGIFLEQRGSILYANISIDIYGDFNNDFQLDEASKRYYYSPLCRIKPSMSGEVLQYNPQQPDELSLVVEMWNEDLLEQITNYTSKLVGASVKREQINVLPLDKVTLFVNSPPAAPMMKELIKYEWLDYQSNQQFVSYPLLCPTPCETLEERMGLNDFRGWTFLFSTPSQILKRKELILRAEDIADVLLMRRFFEGLPSNATEILLWYEQAIGMLKIVLSNLLNRSMEPFELVTPDSVKLIRKILESLLIISDSVGITERNKHLWELVPWGDDTRPDKIANLYNRVYEKLNEEQRVKFALGYRKVNISRVRDVDQSNDVSVLFVQKSCINSSSDALCNPEETLTADFGPNDFNSDISSLTWNGEMFTFEYVRFTSIRSPQKISDSFTSLNLTVWYSTVLFSSAINL